MQEKRTETRLVSQLGLFFFFNFHFTGASHIESVTEQSCWVIILVPTVSNTGTALPLEVRSNRCRSVAVAWLMVSPDVIAAALTMEFIGFSNKGAL